MAWRMAKSLEVLLAEINRRSPARSKASDGGIGNAEHATRVSDHNPWIRDIGTGVVSARDFTNDPGHGFDSSDFAEWLRKRCQDGNERRVKYVISDRRIASPINGWVWRSYSGTNPHTHHVHVSVLSAKTLYDNEKPWGWAPKTPAAPAPIEEDDVSFKDEHKLTAADVAAYGQKALKVGQEKSYDELVRFPPATARLRREMTAQIGALTKMVGALVDAIGTGGTLSAAEAERSAMSGARAALAELGDDPA